MTPRTSDDVDDDVNIGVGNKGSIIPHTNNINGDDDDDAVHLHNTFLQRESKRMARNPCTYLWTSIIVTLVFSFVGLIVGEFAIEVESVGWWSRGTLMANRQVQMSLVNSVSGRSDLLGAVQQLALNESAWDHLMNEDYEHLGFEKMTSGDSALPDADAYNADANPDGGEEEDEDEDEPAERSLMITRLLQENQGEFHKQQQQQQRKLEESESMPPPGNMIAGCDLSFYSSFPPGSLWPMWKIADDDYDGNNGDNDNNNRSVLDVDVLKAICVAETKTQSYLEENGLCDTNKGCDNGKCLPPYSIVLYARLLIDGGFDTSNDDDGGFAMDCDQLADAWTPELQESVQSSWMKRIAQLKLEKIGGGGDNNDIAPSEQYPYGYYPALVESDFDINGGRSQYTSSIFDTYGANNNPDGDGGGKNIPGGTDSDSERASLLYDNVDYFDRPDEDSVIEVAYDNALESFAEIKTDSLLGNDMTLAIGSSIVIMIAIMIHTQSPLITGLGLLQIILSFPMAFFAYKLVFNLQFFPFLNFMGIFVVFALGAGDIYVAFDKWTNYRKANMTKSTEYVAAYALPESTSAMFLTTLTTAVAFFATAVCPVAPIKMFAIFCGMLVIFDYILTIAFIFPALCIYDKALLKRAAEGNKKNGYLSRSWLGCVSCGTCFDRCCSKTDVYDYDDDDVIMVGGGEDVVVAAIGGDDDFVKGNGNGEIVDEEETDRNLSSGRSTTSATAELNNAAIISDEEENYTFTQKTLVKLAHYLHIARWPLLALCVVSFALCCYFASTMQLPESSDVRLLGPNTEFEKAARWRKELLSSAFQDLAGSRNNVIWGVLPADTGVKTNPNHGTSLVLDETFQPSSMEAQIYLKDFCSNLYNEDFARPPTGDFVCAMNKFDQWLSEQSTSDNPDSDYSKLCNGATGIPVAEDKFDACISSWALKSQETRILTRNGVVEIMYVPFQNKALFTDPYDILQEQFDLIEDWMTASNEDAPSGVKQGYSTSVTLYWHDTNSSIQKTAYSGAAIALAASAVIILLSSHSVVLTIFATVTILFILASVTSMLVAIGWTLGFIESICFSILIGISVDFVIHFTHAYVHQKGEVAREERTKYAMITMGPSILATALTTFFSAVVMLFCTITFFQKFALVLFFTVVMATLGSFIFFITLTNCFGPTDPTYMVDRCLKMCGAREEDIVDESRALSAARITSLDPEADQ